MWKRAVAVDRSSNSVYTAGMTNRAVASFGGFRAGRQPLSLQFEKGAPVVLRHDLHKTDECIVPVFEEVARALAAGEEVMAPPVVAVHKGVPAVAS